MTRTPLTEVGRLHIDASRYPWLLRNILLMVGCGILTSCVLPRLMPHPRSERKYVDADCTAGVVAAGLDDLLQRGEAAERSGEAAAAAVAYQLAVKRYVDHALAWAYLGEYLRFHTDDTQRAGATFRRALSAPCSHSVAVAFALRGLGEMAAKRGAIGEALSLFNLSLHVEPLADTHRSLSTLMVTRHRDFSAAAEHAARALELSPDDPLALIQYAVQMIRVGRTEVARAAFVRGLRLGGCDEDGRPLRFVHCCLLYNAACFYAVSGAPEQAIDMLHKFFQLPQHRHLGRSELDTDPDLENLRQNSRYRALIEAYL